MTPTTAISAVPLAPLPPVGTTGSTLRQPAAGRPADAARELESTFLTMLLKEMRQTLSDDEDGGLFPGDTGDVYGGLFDLYVGQHLAASGGVGLAAALDRQLRTTYAPAPPSARGPVGGPIVG